MLGPVSKSLSMEGSGAEITAQSQMFKNGISALNLADCTEGP